MREEDFLIDSGAQNQSSFDVSRFLNSILRKWPWIILSILLFLTISWLYTRYLTDYYLTTTKIVIKDAQKSPTTSDMLLGDVALTSNMNGGIENEMQILKSTKIMEDVVDKLDLNIAYYQEGKVIDIEEYKDQVPYHIKVLNNPRNNTAKFHLNINKPNVEVLYGANQKKNTKVGHTFTINDIVFQIIQNPGIISEKIPDVYNQRIEIKNKEAVAREFKNLIQVTLVNNYTTTLNISLEYPNTQKSEAILTQLVDSYNIDAVKDKNIEFNKTEEFIDERIAILNNELGTVEDRKQSFQSGNEIANLEAEVGMSISNKAALESQLLTTEAQLSLINSYEDHVQQQSVNDILPSAVISGSGGASSAVSSYNEMVSTRKSLLASGATEEHPEVQSLTNSILDAKRSIISNINQQKKSLLKTKNGFEKQLGAAASLKSKAPRLQKESRDIERQQGVKESLFLLLLEKREEAAISSAITQDKAKVIDPPLSVGPVKPKKEVYYIGAFALGLLLPLGVIYVQNLFRNKIETKRDLEIIAKERPILGEIPNVNNDSNEILVKNDINEISEAFRVLRTNADFVLSQVKAEKNKGKVILITSSIKGEGKTFISMNYAHVLSQISDKKVIIIGADIRNPQLHRYTKNDKKIEGLTEFLYQDNNMEFPAINKSKHDNKTDIIFSGQIPPNPTELLMSPKIPMLLEKLKDRYDYIIIDSAPILMVSDTFNLTSYADLTIFITRSNHTPKEVIKYPIELFNKKRVKNLAFVLNDVSKSAPGYSYGYGYSYNYGYGYGYNEDKDKGSIWKRLNPFK